MSNATKHLNVLSIVIAGVSAVVATVLVYFTYGQLRVATDQQRAATEQQIATSRLEDLRFVGRISVELDESDHRIRVSNYSDLPLTDAAVWTLGLAGDDPLEARRLDTIRVPLTGLGACRTMTFSVDTLIETAEENAALKPDTLGPPKTSATEPYLTFEVPSGSWFTISETVVYQEDKKDYRDSIEAANFSNAYQLLGDTVLEGDINGERVLESELPLGPSAPVTMEFSRTAANVTGNGCGGPGR